jgi:hypothetical protein
VKANASKHKAMSYDRMGKAEAHLEEEIAALLRQAEEADAAEDAKYGKGRHGDELPEELKRRESRLEKIKAAKAALEAEAREEVRLKAEEVQEELKGRERKEKETGQKIRGRLPVIPDPQEAVPEEKAQRNFTDPESRIMKDGASKGFEQAYNAQIVVDGESQIIVASGVTQETNDKRQLIPMMKKAGENLGELPEKVSADAGYFSETNVTEKDLEDVDLYIPPDRQKHGEKPMPAQGRPPKDLSVTDCMRRKLRTKSGQEVYRFRKAIVEPVFGQIKEARRFRRFSLRGLVKVESEWTLVCLTHNLLKLFRSGGLLQAA